MNFKQTSIKLGLVASGVLGLFAAPAQAFNFTTGVGTGTCGALVDFAGQPLNQNFQVDNTQLASCQTADGFTLTAGGGNLQGKYVNDRSAADEGYVGLVKGVGVSHGTPYSPDIPGEIGFGEYIDLVLPTRNVLKTLDFSFLYLPGEHGDRVYEVAAAAANLPGITGTLTIQSASSAIWTAGGIVQYLTANSNSTDGDGGTINGGGWYSILNPFGNNAISGLRLTAVSQVGVAATSGRNSDFALTGATVAAVPEPATVLGLGLVAGSLLVSRRRKANKIA